MDTQRRAELIARYKDGYREVAAALDGATDEELDARPGPGQWTAREVVHHLADSEMMSAIRLRLLVAEENAAFLKARHGIAQPIADGVQLVRRFKRVGAH